MAKVNWNKIAREVARREKGKKEVNIAQIKEIIGCVADELYHEHESWEILEGINRLAQ